MTRERREIALTGRAEVGGKPETRRVMADIVGPFGVHRCGWGVVNGWKITHVKTGLSLPYSFDSKADALKLASRLVSAKGVRWTHDGPIPRRQAWRYYRAVEAVVAAEDIRCTVIG